MAKMRVYEYAKAINVSSKEILTALKNMDIVVNNHMAMLEEKTIKQLDAKFKKGGAGVTSQKPAETNKNKPQGINQQPAGNQPNKIRDGKKNDVQNNQFNKNKKNNNKNKNKRNHNNKNQYQQKPLKPKKELPEKITFSGSLTVGALAEELGKEPSELIKKLMLLGVMATINQELDKDTIELIASEYGVETEEVIVLEETELEKYEEADKEEDLQIRPPVVTIMGHVDHGKTTLLDSIRKTKVVEGEAGGITQHIGAYQIEENGKKITFLDTPGHAAFTTMRARGAEVTDITILVVAADDGVMPQTVEAINHAKAAEVPIIVAVNKVDKESANPDRVMQELTEYGLVPEAWGGETIFVPLSALTGKGIDELVEMILLVSEVEELKANPNRQAKGTVIEAELDKGRGSVATLLVQTGTLNVGDPIVVGNTFGRVRAMVNDLGRRVKTAGPSTPVEITGLNDVPQAGDQFLVFKDEKTARSVGEARASKQLEEQRSDKAKLSLDDLFEQIKQGDVKDINLIVKADVQGSAEALTAALQKIEVEGVKVKIIHTGVGAITESDIILASASNAIVIGFNVRPDGNAKSTAEAENVDIRLHRIIYKVIEEIEAAMKGMLDPEYEEKVIGQVEVRQTFKVSKIGTIAGGYVTDGHITRDSGLRLIRDGVVIFEGEVDVLKRFKDDVKEVSQGYECGITIKKYNDIREGDILEAYVMQEIERK
ncbi:MULTISPECIES: translation initiation factor IF-2 [Bacillus amyloliquefaciens group]|uniref:translation initiation factor IF-2 n=1 Tax=Bacillus amyloliquefaciens group TaxID=1938374 RepID=UPI0003964DB0|nr:MULTISPECIES: translation initiation factor IF-2 [Bacillus amyloliquefaciens group]ERH58750.1 translation initiation factor IF-2 [Bacillus amyloliquefaciens EGD-AQ14]MED4703299.1 translation initiation factor IF-2 [Bacillus velezensis]POI16774.1 translation initiation factor IF-2 [Bacillus velezensis]PRS89365.1 translation initiation factor IF-2 [Bacillus velezensis]WRT05215.1 translation initiation factor IF-2 [Bacillus velezensis]